MKKPISLNVLDNVEIATPCTARWEEMTGDDQTRYCSHCSLNVYNISAMTREEATNLIASTEGRLCIRLYRRTDGTVLTQDCPTGIRAARQRLSRSIRNVAATAVALVAGMIGLETKPASAQGQIMGGLAPRHERVEPNPPKKKRDTLQVVKDSVPADKSMLEVKGRVVRTPDMPIPVPIELPQIDSIKTTPTVTEPVIIDPLIPEPMEPGNEEPELSFVMGEMVITNRPQGSIVGANDGSVTDDPGCDADLRAADGGEGASIR